MRELQCFLRARDRLVGELSPFGCPYPAQQTFDALTTGELWEQLPQVVHCSLVVV